MDLPLPSEEVSAYCGPNLPALVAQKERGIASRVRRGRGSSVVLALAEARFPLFHPRALTLECRNQLEPHTGHSSIHSAPPLLELVSCKEH